MKAVLLVILTAVILSPLVVAQTPSPSPTPTPTASPTPTPTPTPAHQAKNPRRDAWPNLHTPEDRDTRRDVANLEALLRQVNNERDPAKQDELAQRALDELVRILKRFCCDFTTMKDGKPVYRRNPPKDPDLFGQAERARGGVATGGLVRIYLRAFRNLPDLYSTLKHEMVHAHQYQRRENLTEPGPCLDAEAWGREVANAANTGLSGADLDTARAERNANTAECERLRGRR